MDVFAQMAGAAMPGIDMARVIPTGPGLPPMQPAPLRTYQQGAPPCW